MKTKDKHKTDVIFYRVFETDEHGPEILAYFPNEKHYSFDSAFRTCYAHIGQHSACDPKYVADRSKCKPCESELEFIELKGELESIGYNLRVKNCLIVKG